MDFVILPGNSPLENVAANVRPDGMWGSLTPLKVGDGKVAESLSQRRLLISGENCADGNLLPSWRMLGKRGSDTGLRLNSVCFSGVKVDRSALKVSYLLTNSSIILSKSRPMLSKIPTISPSGPPLNDMSLVDILVNPAVSCPRSVSIKFPLSEIRSSNFKSKLIEGSSAATNLIKD